MTDMLQIISLVLMAIVSAGGFVWIIPKIGDMPGNTPILGMLCAVLLGALFITVLAAADCDYNIWPWHELNRSDDLECIPQ